MKTLVIILGFATLIGCSIWGFISFYKATKGPALNAASSIIPFFIGIIVCSLCVGGVKLYDKYTDSFEEPEITKISSVKQTDDTYKLYLDNGKCISISKYDNDIKVADEDYIVASWNDYGKHKDETIYMTQATIDNLSNVETESSGNNINIASIVAIVCCVGFAMVLITNT